MATASWKDNPKQMCSPSCNMSLVLLRWKSPSAGKKMPIKLRVTDKRYVPGPSLACGLLRTMLICLSRAGENKHACAVSKSSFALARPLDVLTCSRCDVSFALTRRTERRTNTILLLSDLERSS